MATPRKHWFRVADSVQFEPWSNDVLATLIRLSAALNTRWARDGKSAADAGKIMLRRTDLESCTGRTQFARALRAIRACTAHVSLTVREVDAGVEISWPKWAEFQGLASREFPESSPRVARESPPPHPLPPPPPQDAIREESEGECRGGDASADAAAAPEQPADVEVMPPEHRRSRSQPKTSAPDALTSEQRNAVARWVAGHADAAIRAQLGSLDAQIDACLDWHRAKGNKHADWVAAVRTWIRRSAAATGSPGGLRLETPAERSMRGRVDAAREAVVLLSQWNTVKQVKNQ